ncbi:MAG: TolC family outer membrane protein [Pseudomonadota bacterium]|nr:TolC family outer membrane protein [Pseudomonadota bacterium]
MSISRAGLASMSPALTPLVGALVLAFGAAGAQAQSLTEVVQAARSVDATYLGARSNADAAHYRYEQSRSVHLPTAGLQVQAGRSDNTSPQIGATASGAPAAINETIKTNSVGATVNAQQNLFNRANDLAIDQAQKNEEFAQSQLAQADQDLIVRVAQAYFNVLAAADALNSVQGNSKAIGEQLASAKRNFEVGNATITDTREAEARADLARSKQIAAENDLLVAKVTLDQLVGRNGVVPHPLVLPAVLPPVIPSQASDWVALAESDSQALKQARLGLEVAELQTSKARAGHLPTLVANANYGRSRAHEAIDGFGSFTGNSRNSGVSVTLNVPIFSGFLIQNQVNEAAALERKARTDTDGIHNNVVLVTRTAFVGAQTQAAQVKALEAAVASSKLALDATQLGYKVGVKVNLDVLNAQSQLYQTQTDAAGARYQYLVSQLKLRQAAGSLTTNDLLPIDALLAR